MMDKEKASDAGASTGLHDLARQGSNDLDILAWEAVLKEDADLLRFEYLTWWAALRPDLSPDPAVKARDTFWQRLLSEPIGSIALSRPAAGNASADSMLSVWFVGEQVCSSHSLIAPFDDLWPVVARVRRLNQHHDCFVFDGPAWIEETGA